MPNTVSIILSMTLLIILSLIAIYLGVSFLFLSQLYNFFNQTTAFWSMLLGSMILMYSLYSLFFIFFIKLNEIKNQEKIYEVLVTKFLNKREKQLEKIKTKLNKNLFNIEKKSIYDASNIKIKVFIKEEIDLIKVLKNSFF